MRIGEAAALLRVSADFLRSLEERGAVPPFARDVNGHRRLTDADLSRLRRAIYGPDNRDGGDVDGWARRHGLLGDEGAGP